ncbi:hypothetical protein [Bradyrhizobium sp. SRS-191]|uniref:hypothetical protein n=1 Tax=Bradyrhizobium sp. SRS-191 TaxID=2962606 RepID=UPI00211F14FD|nr:hypothetical protein [Bradyrhizobium sp. SRS-191]
MYAKQKLYEAIRSLTGVGTIQERLTFAALPLVILENPNDEVPAELRAELADVVRALTAKPLSDASGYTPREISDEDAGRLSDRIVSLLVRIMGGL